MKKKILKIVFKTMGVLFLLSPLIDIIPGNNYMALKELPTRCGIVIDKLKPESMNIGKYSGTLYVDQVLVVDYGAGEISDIVVSSSTYVTNNVGDTVCFEMDKRDFLKGKIYLSFIMMLALLIDLVIALWYTVSYIVDIFEDSNESQKK